MKIQGTENKWIRIPLKILLWIVVGVISLVIIGVVAIQLPVVQNFAAQKAVTFLKEKLKTDVRLESISIGFPKTVNLKGLYIEDLQGDTLLYARELNAGIDMLGIVTKNTLNIRSVNLEGITGQIVRLYPDTAFNYSFIIDAFASGDTIAMVSDTSASMIIKLKNVKLADVRFLYNDTLSGTNARVYIGDFETAFDDFDIERMIFELDEISLKNTSVAYMLTPSLVKSVDTSSSVVPQLGLNTFLLENFHATYLGPASGHDLTAMIGKLQLQTDNIDFLRQQFAVNDFLLENADITFNQNKPQQFDTLIADIAKEQGIEKEIADPDWEFTLKKMVLSNIKLAYNNMDSLPAKKGMDFNHIEVSDFELASNDLFVTPGKITLDLAHFSLAEKSGFELNEFSSKISYDTTNITLADLNIQTPSTKITNHLEIGFRSITALADSIEKIKLNINLEDSRIAVSDILHFVPGLTDNPQFNIRQNEIINLRGNITGSLEELALKGVSINNDRSTAVTLSGILRKVMEPERMYASIDNFKVTTTRNDIMTYSGKGLIPEDISIPANINVAGSFKGYLKNFNAGVDLTTTYGNVNAKVKMNPLKGNIEVPYIVSVSVDKMDLGKLLNQQDTLGPVSLTLDAEGTGMNPDSLNAMVRANVSEAFYNQYTYRDLNLEGFVVNRSFHGEVWIKDDNIDLNYTGYVNTNPDSLAFIFDLDLNGVDLKALNLSKEDFKISGAIRSDLAKRYGPNPLGKLKIYDVHIMMEGLDCPMDSVVIESAYDYDSSFVNIRSQFLTAVFKGDIVLQNLAATMSEHFNKYFGILVQDTLMSGITSNASGGLRTGTPIYTRVADTITQKPIVAQNFAFSITMDDPNLICKNLVPALKNFEPLSISGTYNSYEMKLEATAEIPMIDFNDILIDSLYFDIKSDREKLTYEFHVAEISNPNLALEQLDLKGNISDNKIAYNINAAKVDTFNVLKTSGTFAKNENDYLLIIDEPLILNNTSWNMDPDNSITFSDRGLDAQKVILTGEEQMVSIITQPGDDVPLKITFEDFRLSNISLILEKEKEIARGSMNGHITLFKVNGVSAFTSDLAIDSLKFMTAPVGNILLFADNSKNAEQFDVKLTLTGYNNDLSIDGYYRAHDSIGDLNMNVNIPRLNMASIQPFTFGQVSRMSGYLSGGMDIGGTTNEPDIVGDLQFNEVAFNAPYANTYLKVTDNTITIGNKRLVIDNLTLTDTLNNKAVVTGYADFSDLSDLRFDMRVNTENFLAMNSTRSEGEMPVYGKVLLDSDIHVTGSPSSPVVDMKVQLDNGTVLTYVMPETQMTLNQSEGVVIFTDSINANNQIMVEDSLPATRSSVEGLTLSASITFEPEAVLKMLVDPVAGDSLYVSGEGTLNFTMDPGGQMNLTGRYDINNGGYNITLNELIKRQFTLREGSTITWNGDIMDALVDLSAIYTVRTSPMILLEDQLAGAEETERNKFRNNLTFFVYLKMTGELMKPEISFDIEQPENEKGYMDGAVNAKLNELKTDESQLNKQVFALLTLNRFLGQDPFETGNAPLTVESATRASASKLLTQQFSSLSEKYIKGVDLDVGVNSYEDYSSGTQEGRTQLQLGVSKQFLNDRITVQVGGNVELEGERARENEVTDIAGNVNVEYKLTPNGRYRLKAFRRIEYENPIEGELTNTGFGISYSRDFRRFKNLFETDKKRKERLDRLFEQTTDEQAKPDENP
jgi:translocation and assembly module TamB